MLADVLNSIDYKLDRWIIKDVRIFKASKDLEFTPY